MHLWRHTGNAPYQCADCEAKFDNEADTKKHVMKEHGIAQKQADKHIIDTQLVLKAGVREKAWEISAYYIH